MKFKNENKPKIITKKYNMEGYGEYEFQEEVYEKEIKNKITLLEIEITKHQLLESIYQMFNFNMVDNNIQEYAEKFRKINGVFDYIVFILKSKKVDADVLMEILNAVVLAYNIERGVDARPLVMHLTSVLDMYKFDENLMYSVPKNEFEDE